MNGHIRKKTRNGKARYYVVLEQDRDETGQRRRKTPEGLGGFARKKDAEDALRKMLVDHREGNYIEPSKQTFGSYLEKEWLPGIRSTLKPSTYDSYRRNVARHVIPALGAIRLSKLSPALLNDFYAQLASPPTELSGKTIRYISTTIHKALSDAVRWGKLVRNVAALADPPRVKRAKSFPVWTPEQVQEFLRSVSGDRLYALYVLVMTTGMRRGELLGLQWNDVDLEAGRLTVAHTLVSIGYELSFGEPKTDRGRRNLALDAATVAALKAHKARQSQERLAWGPAWVDRGLVFTQENGEAIHPHSISDTFERRIKAAALPRIRFHDTRHCYATLALAAGMKPWELSDRLGHASVAFTLDTYRHQIQASQESAAETAAAFILGE